MTPAEIIAKAQLDTHTNDTNYPAATNGIDALNIVSDEVNNQIVEKVREDYFWDVFKVDTVIGQTEYNITKGDTSWNGVSDIEVNIKQVNKVFIKYDSSSTYYTRVNYQAPSDLTKDLDEYAATQSTGDPFFYVQDRSIFIYPAPTVLLSEGIKLNAIYSPPKIALADVESYLPLHADKHYIYSLGMAEQIYKSQGKINEANNARTIFRQELTQLTTYLKSRSSQAKSKTIGDLSNYS